MPTTNKELSVSTSNLSSSEWTQLYVLKIEKSNLENQNLPATDLQTIRHWLDQRIRELESKK